MRQREPERGGSWRGPTGTRVSRSAISAGRCSPESLTPAPSGLGLRCRPPPPRSRTEPPAGNKNRRSCAWPGRAGRGVRGSAGPGPPPPGQFSALSSPLCFPARPRRGAVAARRSPGGRGLRARPGPRRRPRRAQSGRAGAALAARPAAMAGGRGGGGPRARSGPRGAGTCASPAAAAGLRDGERHKVCWGIRGGGWERAGGGAGPAPCKAARAPRAGGARAGDRAEKLPLTRSLLRRRRRF